MVTVTKGNLFIIVIAAVALIVLLSGWTIPNTPTGGVSVIMKSYSYTSMVTATSVFTSAGTTFTSSFVTLTTATSTTPVSTITPTTSQTSATTFSSSSLSQTTTATTTATSTVATTITSGSSTFTSSTTLTTTRTDIGGDLILPNRGGRYGFDWIFGGARLSNAEIMIIVVVGLGLVIYFYKKRR